MVVVNVTPTILTSGTPPCILAMLRYFAHRREPGEKNRRRLVSGPARGCYRYTLSNSLRRFGCAPTATGGDNTSLQEASRDAAGREGEAVENIIDDVTDEVVGGRRHHKLADVEQGAEA